ncbi:MAG: response regulator [Lachnospiraceae bacterium]|nr:response regulator [Lachnospiraceae bacterium]
MNFQCADQGLILVISATDSFLAKSLVSKLKSMGFDSEFSHGEIKEIDKYREHLELMILFLDEAIEGMSDTLIYLKDVAGELDRKIIVIGYDEEHDIARKILGDKDILEWFKRPLIMDDLLRCITRYMEDNTGENRKKTVLIVDDDITYMRTVYEWLKDYYHVGMAANGVQAIAYLTKNKADLVLLDYEMPVANGPQVLQMLQNESETGHIPVMFLTGHSDKESVMSVIGLKPADYLLKTIDKKTLISKLDTFFEKMD